MRRPLGGRRVVHASLECDSGAVLFAPARPKAATVCLGERCFSSRLGRLPKRCRARSRSLRTALQGAQSAVNDHGCRRHDLTSENLARWPKVVPFCTDGRWPPYLSRPRAVSGEAGGVLKRVGSRGSSPNFASCGSSPQGSEEGHRPPLSLPPLRGFPKRYRTSLATALQKCHSAGACPPIHAVIRNAGGRTSR